MTEHDLDRLAWLRTYRAAAPARGADCPDDVRLAAFVDGVLPSAQRDELMAHVAGCPHCRSTVAAVARVLADGNVQAAIPGANRQPARRPVRWAALAAGLAAALLLVVLVRPRSAVAPVEHRAPAASARGARAVRPEGTVREASSLCWTSVAGADRYRVTLFDADGAVLFESETTDTVVSLAGAVGVESGRTYGWTVDAQVGVERWLPSGLFTFTIDASAR